jgi:hypothetical protein
MESPVRGGTRWKRFAVVMVPSVAATAVLGVALGQGALAASFAVSGQQFKVKADKLVGTGFVQYGAIDVQSGTGKKIPVAVSAFSEADITALCQSVVVPTPFGSVKLRLTAGDKGDVVYAKNIYIDLDQLDTDAEFQDINIGVAAGTKTYGPGMKGGGEIADPNSFSQQARLATLTGVEQTAWATSAGTFKLPDLSLKLGFDGVKECY